MGSPEGTHQPLGWLDRARVRALSKNLHSRFHSVRAAALKEIHAIVHKRRGLKRRLRERLTQARRTAVRKVTPHGLRKPPGAPHARSRPAPVAGPLPAFPRRAGRPLTARDFRERDRAGKAARKQGRAPLLARPREVPLRQGQHEPYPPPGPSMPAHLTDDAIQERWQGAWDGGVREGRERAGRRQNGQRQPDAMQQATETMRKAHAQPAAAAGGAADKARTHRAGAPPLPSQTVREAAQDKGRWAGLRKRTGDAPGRTRSSRTRNRTTA